MKELMIKTEVFMFNELEREVREEIRDKVMHTERKRLEESNDCVALKDFCKLFFGWIRDDGKIGNCSHDEDRLNDYISKHMPDKRDKFVAEWHKIEKSINYDYLSKRFEGCMFNRHGEEVERQMVNLEEFMNK